MSLFNNRKVKVDTKKEAGHGIIWTLIDNKCCDVKKFSNSRCVVQYLYDDKFAAKKWIDEKIQYEVSKELEKRKSDELNKHFAFFLDKDIAPIILNKMDEIKCVSNWEIESSELFNDMVVVRYDASKQVLFQTSNGVVIKED